MCSSIWRHYHHHVACPISVEVPTHVPCPTPLGHVPRDTSTAPRGTPIPISIEIRGEYRIGPVGGRLPVFWGCVRAVGPKGRGRGRQRGVAGSVRSRPDGQPPQHFGRCNGCRSAARCTFPNFHVNKPQPSPFASSPSRMETLVQSCMAFDSCRRTCIGPDRGSAGTIPSVCNQTSLTSSAPVKPSQDRQ